MHRPRRLFFAFSTFAALALTPLAASAQPSSAGLSSYPVCGAKAPDAEKYTSFYTVGRTHYDKREFEEAIRYFNQAYEYDCTKHEILVIISRSHERLAGLRETKEKGKHYREAAYALELFLERQKNDPEADTKKVVIEKLKVEGINADKDAPREPPASATAAAASGPGKEKREHTIYPWIVTGVGGLMLATGTVLFAVGAAGIPSACGAFSRDCETDKLSKEDKDKVLSDANSAGTLFDVGLGIAGVGAAGVAGGLIWHFLEPVDEGTGKAGRIRVQPLVGARERGVAIGGTF